MPLPDWLDPLTLRWLADEEERTLQTLQRVNEREHGPHMGAWSPAQQTKARDIKARMTRYRIIATRIEKRRQG